jgi:hypothetical protein
MIKSDFHITSTSPLRPGYRSLHNDSFHDSSDDYRKAIHAGIYGKVQCRKLRQHDRNLHSNENYYQ